MRYQVYSFDPVQFHTNLQERIVKGGQLRLDLLRDLAIEIASSPAFTARHELHNDLRFGYDEEDLQVWFGQPEDLTLRDRWYVIALASELSPSPSIRTVCHNVLEKVLPLAGWSRGDIRRLRRGKNLNGLPNTYGNKLFSDTFEGLTQHGGWLDLPDIHSLISDLHIAKDYFSPTSSESLQAIDDYVMVFPGDHRPNRKALLKAAHLETSQMLTAAAENNHALFIAHS